MGSGEARSQATACGWADVMKIRLSAANGQKVWESRHKTDDLYRGVELAVRRWWGPKARFVWVDGDGGQVVDRETGRVKTGVVNVEMF